VSRVCRDLPGETYSTARPICPEFVYSFSVVDRTLDSGRQVRIGELSRRVGVRPATLRAWERRYALLEPHRSEGGYRLYSEADEARVRSMTALLDQGVSAAEAAALVREAPEGAGVGRAGGAEGPDGALVETHQPVVLAESVGRLRSAIEAFDDGGVNAMLDRVLGTFSLPIALSGLILPTLVEIGDRWSRGEATVAQEHFATELLRGRLVALARGWGGGGGPLAVLACPPGERHDLGLIAFGLCLRERGWRIAFLGADAPPDTLSETAERLDPAAVVVAAVEPGRFERVILPLRELAGRHVLLVGGVGAHAELARTIGGAHLAGTPVEAAAWITGVPALQTP
jgi:MerR family transcriptional regulator, light-induced transcriptional regulator